MKKLHVHIKIKDAAHTQLALDCARFLGDTAKAWSGDLHYLHTVLIFTVPELNNGAAAEVVADIPNLPSTSKGLSIVGQQWFEDQLELKQAHAKMRASRAKKAAQARWGKEGEQ